MTTIKSVIKKILDVKHTKIESLNLAKNKDGEPVLLITVIPHKRHADLCPYCHKACPRYDKGGHDPTSWRALDLGGLQVELVGYTHRVRCPVHGVVTAAVPWAFPGSRFTKRFDLLVSWMAKFLPKSAISSLMRIDWATVGRCISRTTNALEPDHASRYEHLSYIGVDETSYQKGYKYLTVVVDHGTGDVIWVHEDYGKDILAKFFESLTEEQRQKIKVVTADGAAWITDVVTQFAPQAKRVMDFFHVVEWANEALDDVRVEIWRSLHSEERKLSKNYAKTKGRGASGDPDWQHIKYLREEARKLKRALHALGKAPEHLTNYQRAKLNHIAESQPIVHRSYLLKERLRLLLKEEDPVAAKRELEAWTTSALHSQIPQFVELAKKIKRHEAHIINAFELRVNNARIEAINNLIKLIIRKAFGFRNTQNLIDLIYLICSHIQVPLPYQPLETHYYA